MQSRARRSTLVAVSAGHSVWGGPDRRSAGVSISPSGLSKISASYSYAFTITFYFSFIVFYCSAARTGDALRVGGVMAVKLRSLCWQHRFEVRIVEKLKPRAAEIG